MRKDSKYPTPEGLLRHLAARGVITPGSRTADAIRVIAALPPRCLRVPVAAAVLGISPRKLYRLFRHARLPSSNDWVGLARALRTHDAILRGRPLKNAARIGGYPDQFTMSRAIHHMTGFRPSALRDVGWTHLVDAWIEGQRRSGALVQREPPNDDDLDVSPELVEAALDGLTHDMPDPEGAKARIRTLLIEAYREAGDDPRAKEFLDNVLLPGED